jgi:hypothetical protein
MKYKEDSTNTKKKTLKTRQIRANEGLLVEGRGRKRKRGRVVQSGALFLLCIVFMLY